MWIGYVSHDDDDGTWQFHPFDGQASAQHAAVTSLRQIVAIDSTVSELADLPLGWHAQRDDRNSPWERSPINAPSDDIAK